MSGISRTALHGDPDSAASDRAEPPIERHINPQHGRVAIAVAVTDVGQGRLAGALRSPRHGTGASRRRQSGACSNHSNRPTARSPADSEAPARSQHLQEAGRVEWAAGSASPIDRPAGSVFWFEVVLPYAAADFNDWSEKTVEGDRRSTGVHSGRILLAEDNDVTSRSRP